MPNHQGTIALITGAGHGIGRAIAQKLANEGAAVCVLDIDADKANETTALLKAEGHRAHCTVADITDFDAVCKAIENATEALGEINLLVNNAGFAEAGDLENIPLELWHREIDINLNGPYHCMRALLPQMKERGHGAIVNIGSVNGVRYFGNPAYSAAKAAVINMTQSVAAEYGKYGIRCNAVMPGSVKTDNITWTLRQQKDPEVFKKLARWYPLGRVAEPEDVAKAVSFLASEDASYISGVALPVDGGLLSGMNVMINEFILEPKG